MEVGREKSKKEGGGREKLIEVMHFQKFRTHYHKY